MQAPILPAITVIACTMLVVACDSASDAPPDHVRNISPVAVISGLPPSTLDSEPVTLDASDSHDPDGRIVRFAWYVDGELVHEGDAHLAPEPVALALGNRIIRLTVTDNDGNQDASQRTIHVEPAPVAVISALPSSMLDSKPVTLNASGSHDPDGSIVRFAWHVDDELVHEGDAPRVPEPVMLPPGNRVIRLTVTDNNGNQDTSEWTIHVESAPVAVISGLPPYMFDNETVTLDASGSSDADGSIVRFAWHVDDEPVHEGGAPHAPEPVVLSPGNRVIRLTVTDNDGNQGTSEWTIRVEFVPIAVISELPPHMLDNEPVTLDASSSSDTDGSIVRFAWHVDDKLVHEGDAPRAPELVGLAPGNRIIRLTVTDNDGNQDTSEWAIHVEAVPVAVISGLPPYMLDNEPVTLDASGSSDADGSIVRFAWHVDDELAHEGDAPRAPEPVVLPPGNRVIRLTVTDNNGNQGISEWTIHVESAPVAVISGLSPYMLDNEPVTLNASGSSDADGSIVRFAWHVNDELVYEGYSPRASNPVVLASGHHVVRLTVTDNDGNQGISEWTIRVESAPVAEIYVEPRHVLYGEPVTLDASGSHDPDGSIVYFTWYVDNELIHEGRAPHAPEPVVLAPGHRVVRLTVTDNDGNQDTGERTVRVDSVPVAVISELPQSISFGQPVRLDGSRSHDIDGEISHYKWRLKGIIMGNDQPIHPDYVLPSGTHTIELTVIDDTGHSSRTERTITVDVDLEQLITVTPGSEHAPFKVQLSTIDLADNDFDRNVYGSRTTSPYAYTWRIDPSMLTQHISYDPGPFDALIMPGPNKIKLLAYRSYLFDDEHVDETTFTGSVDPDLIGLYDDRVVTVDIAKFDNSLLGTIQGDRDHYTEYLKLYVSRAFYSRFEDDFDFLMIMPHFDTPYGGWPRGRRYQVTHYESIQNDVRGIGRYQHDDTGTYGSEGRLQGIIVFISPWTLWNSYIGVHEIMHRWGNHGIPSSSSSHWGISTVNGALGGYPEEAFSVRLPQCDTKEWGKAYSERGSPDWNHYAPVELYLAGWIPIDEVTPFRIAPRGRYPKLAEVAPYLPKECHPWSIFTIPEWEYYDHERILRELGPREPPVGEAQSEFKAAVILTISDESPPLDTILPELSEGIRQFSLPGDDGVERQGNFWEATGGRATMEMDRLSRSRKAVPSY